MCIRDRSEWTGGELLIWNSNWNLLTGELTPELTARVRQEMETEDPMTGREVRIMQSVDGTLDCVDGQKTYLVVPAHASSHTHGYLALSKPTTKLGDLDEVALGHAATVFALLAVRRQAVAAESRRLRGDFLMEILDGIPRGGESSIMELSLIHISEPTRPY